MKEKHHSPGSVHKNKSSGNTGTKINSTGKSRISDKVVVKSLKDAVKKQDSSNSSKEKSREGKDFSRKSDKSKKYQNSSFDKKDVKKDGKQVRIDRKSLKPNFELVESLKLSWNKLRERTVDPAMKASLLKEMVKQMQGHVLQVTMRHDASRVVQAIFQFGSVEQREVILAELLEKARDIAKTPYGHFTVLKAITYCTRTADQRRITTALKGHFASLGCNVIGARTVESLTQLYPASLTRPLKAEFYGQKFCVLLPEVPKSLQDLLDQLPERAEAILDHMRDLVQRLVTKGLLEFTFVHQLLWEYAQALSNTTSEGAAGRLTDLVTALSDSAPKLLTSKPGAKAMTTVVTHAGAKERKRILKSLKGHCLESLLHDAAFLGVLRLVDATDDTVSVQKGLLEELKAEAPSQQYSATGEALALPQVPLLSVALHPCGHKLLLRLLRPSLRHLEPDEEPLFLPSPTSKKDPELRRKEHLIFLRSTLTQLCCSHTEQLLRSRYGSRVLEAVLMTFRPSPLVEAVTSAFLMSVGSSKEGEGDQTETEEGAVSDALPLEEEREAHFFLKRIVQWEASWSTKVDGAGHTTGKRVRDSDVLREKVVAVVDTNFKGSSRGKKEQAVVEVDRQFWDSAADEDSCSVACVLLQRLLTDAAALASWAQRNRPCFALAHCCCVPAALTLLRSAISNAPDAEPQSTRKRTRRQDQERRRLEEPWVQVLRQSVEGGEEGAVQDGQKVLLQVVDILVEAE